MFHILVLTSEMWFKKMLMIIMFSEVDILDCSLSIFFFFFRIAVNYGKYFILKEEMILLKTVIAVF